MIAKTRRSLRASPEGIRQANQAILSFASKAQLADELEISRATVQNFFAGKLLARENFHKICQKLNLAWQEIADLSVDTEQPQQPIDVLVQELRQKGYASIQQKCGIIRVLDMSQPIELNDIYTDTYILEKITGRRRLEITDLLKICDWDKFKRLQVNSFEHRISALQAVKQYQKLIILGKPGAGKTTFLKYLAIQCNLGKLQENLVPIFITLKDFAETIEQPSLLQYISGQFANCGVKDTTSAQKVLSQGRAFVLLEGLDQVQQLDEERVLQELNNFFANFHANHYVVTCRIAALEYTFEQFTEVEITDFDQEQINTFINKWFVRTNAVKGNKFIEKLRQNCFVQDLAINPLLLTMLCTVFEELADFPINKAELYKEALDIFLKKWDAKRNIKRSLSKKLSIQHKQDLLSNIALITFKQGKYLFKQNEIKQYINNYIHNLPSSDSDLKNLEINSELVLKSLEVHHGILVECARGIYSFSYLIFQEYLTAKEIVTSSNPQTLETALSELVSRITQKQWHKVFLFTANLLQNADYLLQLAKQQIDNLLSKDKHLQNFLTWLEQKAHTVKLTYKLVAIRALYLDLSLDLDLILNPNLSLALKIDPTLGCDLRIDVLRFIHNREYSLIRSLGLSVDYESPRSLQHLEPLPANQSAESFSKCWSAKGVENQQLDVQIKYIQCDCNWQFNAQQRKALEQYRDANNLLVDCLNSGSYVTQGVRTKIEETLLLAIADL